MSEWEKIRLTGECLLKLAENFWPVIALVVIACASGVIIDRLENRRK